jgi:hypothetical protein
VATANGKICSAWDKLSNSVSMGIAIEILRSYLKRDIKRAQEL